MVTGRVTTALDGLPVPGAAVTIPALGLSTATDAEGRYSLAVPAATARGQRVELHVTFPGLQPDAATVTLTPGPVTQDFAHVARLCPDGHRRLARPGAEAQKAVPVDILAAEQIESTGATETMAVIQALVPSFNFPRPTIVRRHRHGAPRDAEGPRS